MEREFYTNDFEELLKENANQFKMSPSKNVWRGIYNDIHPGRRWPSIAMSLVFVFTLVLVGHLNTQQSKHAYLSSTQKNIALQSLSVNNKEPKQPINKLLQNKYSSATADINRTATNYITQIDKPAIVAENTILSNKNVIPENNGTKKNTIEKVLSTSKTDNKEYTENSNGINSTSTKTQLPYLDKNNSLQTSTVNVYNIQIALKSSESAITAKTSMKAAINVLLNNKTATASHKKIHRNSKINWVYYLSPSVSYRTYSREANKADESLLGYTNYLSNSSLKNVVTHHPSLGLEAGTAFKYSLTKKLKFTSGLQLNYSAYSIQANNVHPIIATLVLHNEKTGAPYSISNISYFGNGPGDVPVNLHNYSVQLSIPVGLEYQLAGNDHLQFSAFGSFQPTLVLDNRTYIVSTDKRNYITEPSLSRSWNMSTNIGTFISFNSNKYKWQVGPQVYYQILSTNENQYQVREHYIDYSIRVGISKLRK